MDVLTELEIKKKERLDKAGTAAERSSAVANAYRNRLEVETQRRIEAQKNEANKLKTDAIRGKADAETQLAAAQNEIEESQKKADYVRGYYLDMLSTGYYDNTMPRALGVSAEVVKGIANQINAERAARASSSGRSSSGRSSSGSSKSAASSDTTSAAQKRQEEIDRSNSRWYTNGGHDRLAKIVEDEKDAYKKQLNDAKNEILNSRWYTGGGADRLAMITKSEQVGIGKSDRENSRWYTNGSAERLAKLTGQGVSKQSQELQEINRKEARYDLALENGLDQQTAADVAEHPEKIWDLSTTVQDTTGEKRAVSYAERFETVTTDIAAQLNEEEEAYNFSVSEDNRAFLQSLLGTGTLTDAGESYINAALQLADQKEYMRELDTLSSEELEARYLDLTDENKEHTPEDIQKAQWVRYEQMAREEDQIHVAEQWYQENRAGELEGIISELESEIEAVQGDYAAEKADRARRRDELFNQNFAAVEDWLADKRAELADYKFYKEYCDELARKDMAEQNAKAVLAKSGQLTNDPTLQRQAAVALKDEAQTKISGGKNPNDFTDWQQQYDAAEQIIQHSMEDEYQNATDEERAKYLEKGSLGVLGMKVNEQVRQYGSNNTNNYTAGKLPNTGALIGAVGETANYFAGYEFGFDDLTKEQQRELMYFVGKYGAGQQKFQQNTDPAWLYLDQIADDVLYSKAKNEVSGGKAVNILKRFTDGAEDWLLNFANFHDSMSADTQRSRGSGELSQYEWEAAKEKLHLNKAEAFIGDAFYAAGQQMPRIALTMMYGAGAVGAEREALGTFNNILFGSEIAMQSLNDKLAEGWSGENALAFTILNTAFQTYTEDHLNAFGIGETKGTLVKAASNAIDKLCKNGYANFFLNLASGAAQEGLEEFVQNWGEVVIQNATRDGHIQNDEFHLSEALYDAAIGAALGGVGNIMPAARSGLQAQRESAGGAARAASVGQAENSPVANGQNAVYNNSIIRGDRNGEQRANETIGAVGNRESGGLSQNLPTGGSSQVQERQGGASDYQGMPQSVSELVRRADIRRNGVLVRLSRNTADSIRSHGKTVVNLDQTTGQQFYDRIGAAKTNNLHGAFVEQHDVQDYNNMRTLVSEDGTVGVAITTDGNIVSVFKNQNSKARGAVSSILLTAIENGGVKLDNFNGNLSNMYSQHGFIPVCRTSFSDEAAPDDWNYERDGRPDIIFWVHNGDTADTVAKNIGHYPILTQENLNALPLFTGENGYAEAEAYRDSVLESMMRGETQAERESESAPQAQENTLGEELYIAGLNGVSASEVYDGELTSEMQAYYERGRQDAGNVGETEVTVNKGRGRHTSVAESVSENEALWRRFAERTGIDIERVKAGEVDGDAAFLVGAFKILISERSENEMRDVLHEVLETVFAVQNDRFGEIARALTRHYLNTHTLAELDAEILRYQATYGTDDYAAARKEWVCTYGAEILAENGGMEAVLQYIDRGQKAGMLQQIRDWLRRMLDALRSLARGDWIGASLRQRANKTSDEVQLMLSGIEAAVNRISGMENGQTVTVAGTGDVRNALGTRQNKTVIREGMTEQERYDALKDVSLTPTIQRVTPQAASQDPQMAWALQQIGEIEKLHPRAKGAAEKIIYPMAERLGILKKNLTTPDLVFTFQFTKSGGLKESLSHQMDSGGSYADFAKVLANLDGLLQNAVLIEMHGDKYADTARADRELQAMCVLVSVLKDGDSIIPVQFEIKQRSEDSRLYMTVALSKIESDIKNEADVMGKADLQKGVHPVLLSASEYRLAQLFKNVKPGDKNFLKYLPDGFLNDEQKAAKQKALGIEQSRIESYRYAKDASAVDEEELERRQEAARERRQKITDEIGPVTAEMDAKAQESGRIKPGERPARDIAVPRKIDKKRVNRWIRTVNESEEIPPEILEGVNKEVLNGITTHNVYSDKRAMDDAEKAIGRQGGYEAAVQRFLGEVSGGKCSKNLAARGEALLLMAKDREDYSGATQIAIALSEMFTTAGQAVQAARLLKGMGAEGKLIAVKHQIEALNRKLADGSYGHKNKGTVVTVGQVEEEANSRLTERQKAKGKKIVVDQSLLEELLQSGEDTQKADKIVVEIYKDVARQIPPSWTDAWNAWRYLCMLFNPTTHVRNVVGNALFIPFVSGKNLIKAGMEATASRIRPNTERTVAVKASRAAKQFAGEDAQVMEQVLRGGGKYNEQSIVDQYRNHFPKVPVLGGVLNGLDRFNSGALEFEDWIFLKKHYVKALSGYLTANKWDVKNLTDGQLERARTYAVKEAQKATYRDVSSAATAVQRLAENKYFNIPVNAILPFKKTPINILKRGIEYSPAGLLKTLTRGSIALHRGEITLNEWLDGVSAGLTGSGIVALGWILSSLGFLTCGFDPRDREDELKELMGMQEYAVQIGGYSYTVDWACPPAIPLFMGAEIGQAFAEDDDSVTDNILSAFTSGLNAVTEMSMLSGLQSAISSIAYGGDNVVLRTAQNVAVDYLSQGLPTVVTKVSNTIDGTRRRNYVEGHSDTPDFLQQYLNNVKARFPNARTALVDAFGREQKEDSILLRLVQNFLSPGYFSRIHAGELEEVMESIYAETDLPVSGNGAIPSVASKYFSVNGEKVYLTAEEYEAFSKERGSIAYNVMNDMIRLDEFKALDRRVQYEVLKEAYEYSNEIAKASVSAYEPDGWQEQATILQQTENISVADFILYRQAVKELKGSATDLTREDYVNELIKAGLDADNANAYVSYFKGSASDWEKSGISLKGVWNAAKKAQAGDYSTFEDDIETLTKDGVDYKTAVKAVHASSGIGGEYREGCPYTLQDYYNAICTGSGQADSIYVALQKTYAADRADAGIRSSLSANFKRDYLEASGEERSEIIGIMVRCGWFGNRTEVISKVFQWANAA